MENTDVNANSRDAGDQPSVDLTHVLQMSVMSTAEPGAGIPTEVLEATASRSKEEKQFLASALDGMSRSHVREMKQVLTTTDTYMQALEGGEEEVDVTEVQAGLEGLEEWLENQDFANDFCKMGGFVTLHSLLRLHKHSNLTVQALTLLTLSLQNNPFCRNAMDKEMLDLLFLMLESSYSNEVRIKALQSLSAFVRSNPSGEVIFRSMGGYSKLVAILKDAAAPEKLCRSTLFFLSATFEEWSTSICKSLLQSGLVKVLLATSQHSNNQVRENSLAIISSLLDTSHSREVCEALGRGYVDYIQLQLTHTRHLPECREETEFLENINRKITQFTT